MKRWMLLLALLGAMALVNCNDDDNGPTDPNGDEYDGTISATVTGDLELEFNCTTAYGLLVPGDGGLRTNGLMQIQGVVTEGQDEYMIDIQVYHDPATGTYALAFPPVEGVATIAQNDIGNFSDEGSVTFTQVSSTRMKGTFSFHAFRVVSPGVLTSIDVEDGTFDVPVIEL